MFARFLPEGVLVAAFLFSVSSAFPVYTNVAQRWDTSRSIPTALNAGKTFRNFDEVLNSFQDHHLLVYFNTPTCRPCHIMKKELSAVKEMMDFEKIKLFSVDTEKWPSLGPRFHVGKLPCCLVFREGQEILRLDGVLTAEVVAEQLRKIII